MAAAAAARATVHNRRLGSLASANRFRSRVGRWGRFRSHGEARRRLAGEARAADGAGGRGSRGLARLAGEARRRSAGEVRVADGARRARRLAADGDRWARREHGGRRWRAR